MHAWLKNIHEPWTLSGLFVFKSFFFFFCIWLIYPNKVNEAARTSEQNTKGALSLRVWEVWSLNSHHTFQSSFLSIGTNYPSWHSAEVVPVLYEALKCQNHWNEMRKTGCLEEWRWPSPHTDFRTGLMAVLWPHGLGDIQAGWQHEKSPVTNQQSTVWVLAMLTAFPECWQQPFYLSRCSSQAGKTKQ